MDCPTTNATVPPFFVCPISLEIMEDPVTISSGMTFDRRCIQTWLFSYNQGSCPITKQPLPDKLLTPNSNLLRLIQSWMQLHDPSSAGKKVNLDLAVNRLLEELKQGSTTTITMTLMKSVKKMKTLVQENDCFRKLITDAGVDKVIVSSLAAEIRNLDSDIFTSIELDRLEYMEEAVSLLYCLKIPKEKLKTLSQAETGEFVSSLSVLLIQQMNTRAKSEIVSLLKSIFRAGGDLHKLDLKTELFQGILEILKDQNSGRGSKAALSTLAQILPDESNRRKAVEAGFVPALIELLMESAQRRPCELILLVLESLCKVGCGRAAMLDHVAGLAAVSSKIMRISQVANDRAVSMILCLFRYCEVGGVAGELMEVGGVAKMCMVVQSECRAHTKDKAREILGFYIRSSDKYPCLPSRFIL